VGGSDHRSITTGGDSVVAGRSFSAATVHGNYF